MTTRKTPPRAAKRAPSLQQIVGGALEEMKAVDVRQLDVRGMTDIADTLFVASGNSDRHVRSIADRVIEEAKAAGFRPFGIEGAREGEWVLVDLNDVVVHVMLPRVREFYALERLWEAVPAADAPAGTPAASGSVRKPVRRRAAAARAPRAAP